ncbi:MAG: bifunctional UDP-N-acetylglucosamine diphosphorylase/glucosamine-1-phosphate N-acetyltransferase GlmU [Alphaproteobacteria bacterium]|jgi:bifunctional UDP-N-acetylglucosamine pyrophosphorylase/glucosamine-1-phosphate N-acetyltransferase|nr:bifunctional UDP-N-acetylglucosamine diphosphorylase/glucosamine-1-phosphate N-acetyltransferase GlmU [Alphaproteobacteria bacterium]QQS57746.1 MAG: bifunctional UDP-N-acetylglucosamine diphosphorylase/glucosamine-1-phosphate N-acetyltransferase GlmU [Alphaproteobacteria bacterium]
MTGETMTKRPLACVILAAGRGVRMKSKKPKVMNELLGWPMIKWLLESVRHLEPERTIVVVGPGMEDLVEAVHPCEAVLQPQQDGTGSALKCAMNLLQKFNGDVLVLLGDTPMISPQTLWNLIQARQQSSDTGIAVLGTELSNPTGYGRLLLDVEGNVAAIREEKDATLPEKMVRLINTGAFCMDGKRLERWLGSLTNRNAQKEYYITDLPEIAARDGYKTRVQITFDADEVRGCNTRADLAALERIAQKRMREHFLERGVTLQDPESVFFHFDTILEEGVVVEPNVYFGPGVEVGEGSRIRAFSHLEGAKIGSKTTVGPFARLRPGTVLGDNVRIGNFVEIKKSTIGDRSKVSHLGYVGDCEMGEDVNFGCGAITVNYDGFEKHTTIIGKGVMVGSNVNLIAPLIIDDGAFIAAGSTITQNVPADALSLSRAKEEVRKGWAATYRQRKAERKKK